MSKNSGKIFEEDVQRSCISQDIFYHRIKDTYIPFNIRQLIARHKMYLPTPKNEFDNFIFYQPYLFPIELKSTKQKSISLKEEIIKQHQIDNLLKANNHEKGIISGLIFNFRESNNATYFVHIEDFVKYKEAAEGKVENTYKSKINKSSIPIGICEEIGIEIPNEIKRTRVFYDIEKFIEKIIERM